MGSAIKIIIADDHPLFREGVARTMSEFVDCEVVAACANADNLLVAVCEQRPDVVLLDINIPGGGFDAARRIETACPGVRVVILTASEQTNDVLEALEVGACGYVLKGVGGSELARIITTVHRGGVYVTPSLAARILVDVKDQKGAAAVHIAQDLTVREKQILEQISQGMSNREAAVALTLSEKTVKHYVSSVLQKMQVRNRVEAAIKAREYLTAN